MKNSQKTASLAIFSIVIVIGLVISGFLFKVQLASVFADTDASSTVSSSDSSGSLTAVSDSSSTVSSDTSSSSTQDASASSAVQAQTASYSANSCSNQSADLSGSIPRSGAGDIATIANNSSSCSYQVGMASYKVYSSDIKTQVLFDTDIKTVGPNSSVNFHVNTPDCSYQTDLFFGSAISSFAPNSNFTWGETYHGDNRFIDGYGGKFSDFCNNNPSTPVSPSPATLKLVKTVVNTHGGTKQVSDFALFENGVQVTSGQDKSYSFASSTDSVQITATENNLANYSAGAWGGDCSASGIVTLHPGDSKTCTITNSDIAVASDCPYSDGIIPEADAFSMWQKNTGKIVTSVTIDKANGQAVGTLTNNTGCSLPISQVTYKMFDRKLSTQQFFDYAPDTASTTVVGPHSSQTLKTNLPVCMSQSDLYYGPGPLSLSDDNYWGRFTLGWAFNMNNGVSYNDASGNFCSNSIPTTTTLKVIKTVVNNGLGTKHVSDFKLYVNNTEVTSGVSKSFDPGTYSISEHNLAGYTASDWGGDCSADGKVTLSSGDNKTCTVTDTYSIPAFSASCSANTSNPNIGDSVIWTANATGGVGSYTYSWSGSEIGLTGSGSTTSIAYSSVGSKHASVIVTSGDASTTAKCSTTVQSSGGGTTNSLPFSLMCIVNPQIGNIGDSFTFTASSTGGVAASTTIYSWSGDENATGTSASITKSFSSVGTKNITVNATSGTQSASSQCSIVVNSVLSGGGGVGGGSYINYGGGGGPVSSVNLIQEPGGKVAGVFLSQVPYTGIGSNMKIAFFSLALLVWSFIIAYYLVKKTAEKNRPYAFASMPATMEQFAIEETKIEDTQPEIQIQTTPIGHSHEEIVGVLEVRARELETLISADGLETIVKASHGNKNNAVIVLDSLVGTYKSADEEMENNWTVLNREKINKALFPLTLGMTKDNVFAR